ncbi:MAG TPA: alpha/beta hydrolase-fold protein, partial [Polyangiaceae bacterium]|nr:alpha/beta hydrolase-fold protein [Polyangiaceae bacterium]
SDGGQVQSDAGGQGGTQGLEEAGTGGASGTGATGTAGASGGYTPEGGTEDVVADVMIDVPEDAVGSLDCERLVALDAALVAASNEGEKVSLLEQTLVDVEKSDGFPIRCAPDATFFFRRPQGWGHPHLVGEFNGWDPTATPMVLVAEDLYRVTVAVDTGPHRMLYKFSDGVHWVADPMARRFGFDEHGEYSLVQGGNQRGHLERYLGVAGNGLSARPLTVYVPPGYEQSTQSYPVLYAHDGQNLFDPGSIWGGWHLDDVIENLLSSGEIKPLIVVGVHNTTARMDEYTHVQDVVSGQTVGGAAEMYFGLLATRVMPLVASHYRVKAGPENTWTMGSSLGGLVSLYVTLKHPDVFGKAAGLSSTLGWGSIQAHNPTLIEMVPSLGKPDVVLYLDSGGTNGGGCVDSDGDGIRDDNDMASDNYCETEQMRDVLAAEGYEFNKDLFHWHEMGAPHNEAAWSARVFRPLRVLAAP